jgi:hypothetical protein
MIRNAVLALNQANTTGNYSVLREMGTPNFQMANSPARLAEVFASLRARKIDLSPIMLFNPKLTSQPALQDGQVLRLTGFFPTTPEQVQFDLAFQHLGDRWMRAGIALNEAPPGEGAQAAALSQPAQTAETAKPGEAKPIRIDLSQPGKPGGPAKKPAAKKPKAPAQKAAAAQGAPAEAEPGAEKPAEKSGEPNAGWSPFGR